MAQRASQVAGGAGGASAPSGGSTASSLRGSYYGGGSYYQGSAQQQDSTDDVFFGGVSALAEHLDRTMLLVLRDGRLLFGTLSSYDQYGSIVLENARERLTAQGKYADIDMGMYMIRGENIMLMGELVRHGQGLLTWTLPLRASLRSGVPRAAAWPPSHHSQHALTPTPGECAGRGAGLSQPTLDAVGQGGGGGAHCHGLEKRRGKGRGRWAHVRGHPALQRGTLLFRSLLTPPSTLPPPPPANCGAAPMLQLGV